MNFILTIVALLIVLGAVVFVHELGHFLVARWCGVLIQEFAIGMGPRLAWFRSKKTGIIYALRAFPFGGFVSMEGEDEESLDEGSFSRKPWYQRFIILSA